MKVITVSRTPVRRIPDQAVMRFRDELVERRPHMLRRIRWVVVLGALLCVQEGVRAGVLVDFDTLPGGGPIASGTPATNPYASWGVTFTGFEDGVEIAPEIRSHVFLSTPASPPNYLTNFFNFPSTNNNN